MKGEPTLKRFDELTDKDGPTAFGFMTAASVAVGFWTWSLAAGVAAFCASLVLDYWLWLCLRAYLLGVDAGRKDE